MSIVAALFLLRMFLVIAYLPKDALVPDESTYIAALDALVRGEDIVAVGNRLGYGPTIFTGSWLLLRPAQLFTLMGVGSLDALRLSSLILGVVALLLVVSVTFRARTAKLGDSLRESGVAVVSVPGIALLALLLLPSHQVWGLLALRDSSAIFSMALAGWGLALVSIRPTRLTYVAGFSGLVGGIAGAYMSRSYLALILSAALVAAAVVPPFRRRIAVSIAVVAVVVVGNFLGAEIRAFTPGEKFDLSAPPIASDGSSVAPLKSKPAQATMPAPQSREEARGSVLAVIDSRVTNFYTTREGLREGAESAFPTNYCAPTLDSGSSLVCEAINLPLGAYRFLLTPNLLETGISAPPQRVAAGAENVIWFFIFVGAIATLIARRSVSPRMTVFSVSLLVLSTVAYALVSGNEGTAFRHKGQFLWAWCLVIALGYGWRPWVRSLRRSKRVEVKTEIST